MSEIETIHKATQIHLDVLHKQQVYGTPVVHMALSFVTLRI